MGQCESTQSVNQLDELFTMAFGRKNEVSKELFLRSFPQFSTLPLLKRTITREQFKKISKLDSPNEILKKQLKLRTLFRKIQDFGSNLYLNKIPYIAEEQQKQLFQYLIQKHQLANNILTPIIFHKYFHWFDPIILTATIEQIRFCGFFEKINDEVIHNIFKSCKGNTNIQIYPSEITYLEDKFRASLVVDGILNLQNEGLQTFLINMGYRFPNSSILYIQRENPPQGMRNARIYPMNQPQDEGDSLSSEASVNAPILTEEAVDLKIMLIIKLIYEKYNEWANAKRVLTTDTLYKIAIAQRINDPQLEVQLGNKKDREMFIDCLTQTSSGVITVEDFEELAYWIDLQE